MMALILCLKKTNLELKFRKLLVLLLFTLFILSCNRSEKLNKKDDALIIKQVKTTLTQYYKDIQDHGLMAEFKYLDSSENFFWVPPGHSEAMNYQAVKKAITENALKYKSVNNTFETLKIVPLSVDLATYTARLKSTMTDTSNTTISLTMIETGTLIKRGDNWKLLCGQTGILK